MKVAATIAIPGALLGAIFGAILGIGLLTGLRPASAEVNYPWCIITGGTSEGVMSCGYLSFAQCQQTRIGVEMCVPNPRYQAPASSAPRRPAGRG
jgi:hypothetical protein